MENKEVAIREATLGDADEVSPLCEQLSRKVSASEVKERLEVMLGDPKHHAFLVAEDEGKVVGFVHVVMIDEILSGKQARIDGVVVDEGCRGKGAGRSLMAAAEKWAHKNGSKTVKLNSNVIRTESHKFYEHLGYERAKEQIQFKKQFC